MCQSASTDGSPWNLAHVVLKCVLRTFTYVGTLTYVHLRTCTCVRSLTHVRLRASMCVCRSRIYTCTYTTETKQQKLLLLLLLCLFLLASVVSSGVKHWQGWVL